MKTHLPQPAYHRKLHQALVVSVVDGSRTRGEMAIVMVQGLRYQFPTCHPSTHQDQRDQFLSQFIFHPFHITPTGRTTASEGHWAPKATEHTTDSRPHPTTTQNGTLQQLPMLVSGLNYLGPHRMELSKFWRKQTFSLDRCGVTVGCCIGIGLNSF